MIGKNNRQGYNMVNSSYYLLAFWRQPTLKNPVENTLQEWALHWKVNMSLILI